MLKCNVEVIGGGGQCGAREARLARPRWRAVVGWTFHPRRRMGGGWGDVWWPHGEVTRGDKTVSGDKTVPGDKTSLRMRKPNGRAASTAAVAMDGADSQGKANDKEVCGDAAAVSRRPSEALRRRAAWSSSRWFIYRGSSQFVDNAPFGYICTLHFGTSSTRCWTVLCSSSSCVRLSNSGWTSCKTGACRCT